MDKAGINPSMHHCFLKILPWKNVKIQLEKNLP
jgi:hypothetical protein